MTIQVEPTVLARTHFPVFDVDGVTLVTGLLDAAFTKLLFKDAAADATVVTVTEIGATGIYEATFTPATAGLWFLQVTTPNDDVFGEQFEVGSSVIADKAWSVDPRGAGPTAFPAAGRVLDRIRVYLTNRNEIDFTNQRLVAYEDDGLTVAQRWDLETDAGAPNNVVVQAGAATKRKDPLDSL